ncbi:MAG: CoA-binding protein [Actinomycetota bacterium]|nr:CoA-binding protein [Actinomycetota bacterium]
MSSDILDTFRSLFYPRSIAVIGATDNAFKLGYHTLKAVTVTGFEGEIYPVNPSAGGEIQGFRAYSSISDLPRGVDLFVYAIPEIKVVPAVRETVENGGRAGVIFAGGFRETGPDGVTLQEELVSIADKGGMKLIGPNCIGIANTHNKLNATFASGMAWFPSGDISIISQSGGMGNVLLNGIIDEARGLSKFVSIGNQANVKFADMVEYLAEDPHTGVVCLFVEGIDEGSDFIARAREVSRKKPILVYNRGYTEKSAQTALSHTGSVASSEAVYHGAFQQTGLLQLNSIQELACVAKALSIGARLSGRGVFISTHTAGPAVVISDICERGGIRFPELRPDIAEAIAEFVPQHSIPRNPLDVFAFAWTDPSLYLKSTDLALAQEDIHCAVAVFVSAAGAGPVFPTREYAEIGRKHGKPVFLCLIAPSSYLAEMEQAQEEGVIALSCPEKMGHTLVNLARFSTLENRGSHL